MEVGGYPHAGTALLSMRDSIPIGEVVWKRWLREKFVFLLGMEPR